MSAPDGTIDVAIIGAGVAGSRVALAVEEARPDWSIMLVERMDRVGGRLRSVRVEGLHHPIELGGMRFLTSHRRVTDLVDDQEIATHPFDATGGGKERSYLRGVVGGGADDEDAGRAYGLPAEHQGRSAAHLARQAFEGIVPGFQDLDHDGYAHWRATGTVRGHPVTQRRIGDALEELLGDETRRFVTDAFGYDSGMRAFCAPDLVEFLFDGGDPTAVARTPDEGMERIPQEMAARFKTGGGDVRLGHELSSLDVDDGAIRLRFSNGARAAAQRVVLATPQPALRRIASTSDVVRAPAFDEVFESVEGFPAMKLYLWYEHAWWRPAISAIRTTTDLPLRKIFYFDGSPGSQSVLLAMYTDGLHVRPWLDLYTRGSPGAMAPPALIEEVQRQLQESHPEIRQIPAPLGSALMYWGADPNEVAWHFSRRRELG